MRGLRIVSRIYLSLAAIATAVLWFFPWVQVREGIAGGMNSLNSLIQLFITDAEQSAAVEKVLSKTGFSAFDLEKLCKSLHSFVGQTAHRAALPGCFLRIQGNYQPLLWLYPFHHCGYRRTCRSSRHSAHGQ